MAIGHNLRIRAERLHSVSAYLLALNAIAVAAAGGVALGSMDPAAGKAWLVGVAVVHLGVGLAGPRFARISRDLGLLSLAIGAVLADVAFGSIADDPCSRSVGRPPALGSPRWSGGSNAPATTTRTQRFSRTPGSAGTWRCRW